MTQRFIKGKTNNHLTWVMVDATDFATPESALSAATKIKIYGKLAAAAGVNFVSSGTGSLTNDITHVGASALGIYSIGLVKADLSDASAAWYDQYIVSLSATGAAFQAIVVDGGIMESYLSAALSDTLSAAVALSDAVSNTYSAAIIIQSRLSDLDSRIASDFSDIMSNIDAVTATVSASDISDIASAVWATALATKLVQLNTSDLSDLRSAIAAGPAATVTASDISDIASAVWAAKYTANSAASSFGSLFSDVFSRIALIQSTASDAASGVTVLQSRITSVTATSSDLVSKIWSDFQSKMGVSPSQLYSVVLIGASAASDAASAAAQANSRVLLVQSRLSDLNSVYTSDISDIRSMLTALSGAISDVDSATNSQYSDLASKIGGITATVSASDISDIASAVRVTLDSDISDIRSMLAALSGAVSDVDSAINSQYSDLASKIGNVSVTLGASEISDIASQVVSAIASAVIDVNIVQVNGHVIDGSGTDGDPWGPA